MAKIYARKVLGAFILIETETGVQVLSLRDWNLNNRSAEILFSANSWAEALTYEKWAESALREVI